jgi:hypothetical protein
MSDSSRKRHASISIVAAAGTIRARRIAWHLTGSFGDPAALREHGNVRLMRNFPGLVGALWALLLALLLWAPATFAWNGAGHRLGAAIAWQALDAPTRDRVVGLLRQHPDYARWRDRSPGGERERDRDAFIEASTWADDIRDDPRFADEAAAGTAPLAAGFPDLLRHRDWHYVNRPLNLPAAVAATGGELDRQLERLARIVGDARREGSERAWALVWLIHLVGDAHQPLHVGSRFDAKGEGDRGGNSLRVATPFALRRPATNLHAYWDELPGPPWLRAESLAHAAATLMLAYPRPPADSPIATWLDESFASARDDAYPRDSSASDAVEIGADFHARSREIAERRVVWSGYRLAEVLQRLLREP